MKKLYLFNPDADLALANNTAHYMPSAAVRQMAGDLALLPAWYAGPGSAVLAPSAYNEAYLEKMRGLFGLEVQLVTRAELPDCADMRVVPWGWNRAVHSRLLKGGYPKERLPHCETLCRYREEASRVVASLRLSGLSREPFCTGVSDCLQTLPECRAYVEDACSRRPVAGSGDAVLPGCVLKSPWSGSGKGLNWCREGFTSAIEGWCARVLREQGCVVASPIYNKVQDIAMEFYSDGEGQVRFVAYSCFTTNASGAYVGNELLPPPAFERRMAGYLPELSFADMRRKLEHVLAPYAQNGYEGYLGVDMMVCRSSSGFLLHPCVEVNLRMNMGVVAHFLQQHVLAPGIAGRFSIEYFPTNAALQAQHRRDAEDFPLCVENGKVLSGYLPLTPVTPQCRYRASVWTAGSLSFP